MPEPTIPALARKALITALESLGILTTPDLPAELRPLHRRYGTWWKISYEPGSGPAPYVARPRCGKGRNIRADTANMLGRVLARRPRPRPEDDSPNH